MQHWQHWLISFLTLHNSKMKTLTTGVITGGLAIGNAFVYKASQNEPGNYIPKGIEEENDILQNALAGVKNELSVLGESNEIFAAHFEMADDPMIAEQATALIEDGLGAYEAILQTSDALCAMFDEIDDEYLKARKDDVKDVCRRIARKITGEDRHSPFEGMREGSIIVAEELVPSDTALIDFSLIEGFVTALGSRTSHVCIIAASKDVTAMVGVAGCTTDICDGDKLILDGENGLVIINPDEEILREYEEKVALLDSAEYNPEREIYTEDGERVWILGNAGNPEDVAAAIKAGAEGIGLFRSEFLYMESEDFPDEECQYKAYSEAARICGERPLTIRTLDIGGDKALPYMQMEKEENPFLGYRAIRISLASPEQFKTQIRAILRAGAEGNVRMMFPMITTLNEFKTARQMVDECISELENEGLPCDRNLKVGMMIETPASVLLAEEFAQMADFFSIGTNDLTQYIMAADRGNAKISHLYNPESEAVTKAISNVIEAGKNAGIEVSMCGEYAADLSATDLLLRLGLRKFSVSTPAIRRLKSR